MIRFAARLRLSPSVLIDADLCAEEPFIVITGPSGAGKTSILKMIAGILKPDSGSITVGSVDYFDSGRKIDLPMSERRVGFVFQNYALFPHLTGYENVSYGVREGGRAKVLELMATFHIEHLEDRRPRQMSGGEQQRVALARALATDPSVVLLDEPLSAVDSELRGRLIDEIVAAQTRWQVPFVYVTHNLQEAERLPGRQIRIENGHVVPRASRET